MCGYLPLSCSVLIFFINSFIHELYSLLGCDIELHLLLLTGELLLFYCHRELSVMLETERM